MKPKNTPSIDNLPTTKPTTLPLPRAAARTQSSSAVERLEGTKPTQRRLLFPVKSEPRNRRRPDTSSVSSRSAGCPRSGPQRVKHRIRPPVCCHSATLRLKAHHPLPVPPPPTPHAAPRMLPILAELTPRTDGSFILKPKPSEPDLDSWVSAPSASEMIGLTGRRSIYRLIEPTRPLLVYKRPLKNKILISVRSIHAFIHATNHPDFWWDDLQKRALEHSVQSAIAALHSRQQ